MFMYGGDGRVLKVHYKGQRGEGVYNLDWEGLIKNVQRRYRETFSENQKAEYEQFMRITPCECCGGQRLKKSALGMSGGQQQRLCIARALLKNPSILILDDTTSAVQEGSIGYVDKDSSLVKPFLDACLLLEEGQVSEWIERLQRHNFQWEDKSFDELYKEYPKCKVALQWWCNCNIRHCFILPLG